MHPLKARAEMPPPSTRPASLWDVGQGEGLRADSRAFRTQDVAAAHRYTMQHLAALVSH